MSTAFTRVPHIEGATQPAHPSHSPNAALLVDFDNVTMGMRSDLSKELKTLLGSDIIRGKVTVQRAYADWRRYPQYIVPLSEASIDLIFAPAYGSSKKNATDIRMAIDGMELVFTRPEIGTYILLTGDSDFSSLVLKLKEYGKYVIGVGIQESSSDILVQNCDEYYSYTSLSGLRKTSDGSGTTSGSLDPWVLVERAVEQMAKRNDVMRSDRLKQVMLEIDPGFEEKSFGFSKFSRFLTEAAQKGLLRLRKMENGQYEVMKTGGEPASKSSRDRKEAPRRSESRRSEPKKTEPRKPEPRKSAPRSEEAKPAAEAAKAQPPVSDKAKRASAYELLRRSIRDLIEDQDGDAVRDSDVKRRMLALDSSFDEAEMGFGKFSRFLRQAHEDQVVDLRKTENGQYHVALRDARPASEMPEVKRSSPAADRDRRPARGEDSSERAPAATEAPAPSGSEAAKEAQEEARADRPERTAAGSASESRRLRPRLGGRRRGKEEGPPPLLEGQAVGRTPSTRSEAPESNAAGAPSGEDVAATAGAPTDPAESAETAAGRNAPAGKAASKQRPAKKAASKRTPAQEAPAQKVPSGGETSAGAAVVDPAELRLPTGRASIIKYLTNSYSGVGQKTAETLVDALGEDLFRVLQRDPSQVEKVLPPARAEKVLAGWKEDIARRKARAGDNASR